MDALICALLIQNFNVGGVTTSTRHSLHAVVVMLCVSSGPFKGKQVQLAKCRKVWEWTEQVSAGFQMGQINISKAGAAYLTAMHISTAGGNLSLLGLHFAFRAV